MPDTYTKEQIAEAKAALMGVMTIATATGRLALNNCEQFGADILTVLSALSAAEQERDENERKGKELCVLSGNLMMERDALAARCAELEARLQGAGWISVEERLPNVGQTVDVWDAIYSRRVPCVKYEGSHCWVSEHLKWSGCLSHWMPPPKPPAILDEKKED